MATGCAVLYYYPVDNKLFAIELEQLKRILKLRDISDRHVVVVSIEGAMRCSKSFLLNFFIKYLCAQYKRHDMTEWMGKHVTQGFQWQSEQNRKTVGIWIWSEIFTHDFDNGDKVAIILLGTQGLIDGETSLKTCSSIFALNIMLSSVQCFNVTPNIRGDHSQYLRFVTEYGMLASKRWDRKPFQKLMFLIRDWTNEFETSFGYHEGRVADELLTTNIDQTADMVEPEKTNRGKFQ